MRTIKQALIDEVFYPINEGFIDNKLILRGLNGDEEITKFVMESNQFRGALADCLVAVVEQAVNISEADKSVNVPNSEQLRVLRKKINALYVAIGEPEQEFGFPTCHFGW